MLKRYIAYGVVALALATPAFAATQYYVEHKPGEQTCDIAEQQPDGKTTVMVGDMAYSSKADAIEAMDMAQECAPPS